MRPFRLVRLALACLVPGSWLPATEPTPENLLAEFSAAPFPSVLAYAQARNLPLTGVALAESPAPQPGDTAVYLLELSQGGRTRQWLVQLTAAALNSRAGDPASLPADTFHTSTGLELHYTNTPAALEIAFIGPFSSGEDPAEAAVVRRGRAVVGAESLELGLVRYCEDSLEIIDRLKAAGIARPRFQGASTRFDAAAIAAGRKVAAAFQLRPDEERLAFSVFFALRSFYAAANEIPACREVLEAVIAKPSLWTVATHLGVDTNFEYGWQDVRRLPPTAFGAPAPAYVLPVRLSLNGRPALAALIGATTTQPPLRCCAGIAALVVRHPTEPNRRAVLRLLSARPAAR